MAPSLPWADLGQPWVMATPRSPDLGTARVAGTPRPAVRAGTARATAPPASSLPLFVPAPHPHPPPLPRASTRRLHCPPPRAARPHLHLRDGEAVGGDGAVPDGGRGEAHLALGDERAAVLSSPRAKMGKTVDEEIRQNDSAQVVGWPPVRSYRKNTMATSQLKSSKEEYDAKQVQGFLYVMVSMYGALYLRKVDLKTYKDYKELSLRLEKIFVGFSTGS